MPQLVKGGKYVFGWSRVSGNGAMVVPPEALSEYGYEPGTRLILMPGSVTSGGFSASTLELLESSPMGNRLADTPLADYASPEGAVVDANGKPLCGVTLHDGGVLNLSVETLGVYGVRPGDRVLAVRGSRLGIGFIVRGPIIVEARRHPEIKLY